MARPDRVVTMGRPLVSSFCLLLTVPGTALGQNCAGPLQSAAEAASGLPGDTPYEVADQLQAYHDEASALVETDPPACLAIVARMNALIERYLPGSAHGGRPGEGARPMSSVPGNGSGSAVDAAAATVLADLQSEDSERLSRRIARAADEEGEHLQAVGAYRDAMRDYAGAMRAFAASRRSDASQLSEIDAAVAQIETRTRELEQIVVLNAPDDVMHARLEDAVRHVEEARRALERAWQRYYAREAARREDFLAPLVPPAFEPAPLERDFLAPLGDADTRAAQRRLRKAEQELKQVRNSWDPHVHRRDRLFLDMREGYKQAYKSEHERFADELEAFDATLDAYMPGRIADFTRRRTDLVARHERRLDAIFDRYAIPVSP